MSPRPEVPVSRDKAVEVFVYALTLTLLVVVIIGSHLVMWDDMNRREAIRLRKTSILSAVGTSETQSAKSGYRAFGPGFDSPRLHGGEQVSTGGETPVETAVRRPTQTAQTNTRQLRVAAGGLNSSLRDAGSLGHRNQPYQTYDSTVRRSQPYPALGPMPRRTSRSDGNAASQGLPMRLGVTAGETASLNVVMEPKAQGAWRTMEASGYAVGCTLPSSGREPNHDLTASGARLEPNWSVAAHREYPFGTVLEIAHAGILTTRIVHDRGRAITQGKLDLAFADCERARAWGRRTVWVREVRRPLGGVQ